MTLTPEQEAALLAKLAAKTPAPGLFATLYRTLKELLGSKKFAVASATAMVFVAKKLGLDISHDAAQNALTLGAVLIGGYAVQDYGEGKVMAAAIAATPPAPTIVEVKK